MNRWVLHLDMDAFFASVEQLTRPTLRGRPVLVGGLGGRGVVAGASYEARVFGARSAMPMHQARRLVGGTAVVLPPRGGVYRIASRRVFDTVRQVIPVIELLSFDEGFGEPAELVGAGTGVVEQFCADLRARVLAATGLIASVGAGSGKQVAKIASDLAKPDGVQVVSPDGEVALLHSLPVRRLWGIGPVAEEKLHRLGVDTIGALAALTDAEVADILGGTVGPALHRLAWGIDDRPVAERAEAKQISAESTFPTDLTTVAQLHEVIGSIAEHAHQRLRRDGRGARTVTVKLKKSDMATLTRSATLPYATTDAATLIGAARRLLLDPQQIGPIRLLGVGFSGLTEVRQESLFPGLELAAVADVAVEAARVADLAVGAGAAADLAVEEGQEGQAAQVAAAAQEGQAAQQGQETGVAVGQHAESGWQIGDDLAHPEFGHGWVQGAGHGVVTVRFETRSSGPGPVRTLAADDPDLTPADPLASLDWPEYVAPEE